MTAPRLPMSVSLDLDNLWSYQKIHGDPGWESLPSYLDQLAPLVVERLARHDLKITIFIVGQDAALPENGEALSALIGAGHETGNHSFHHEPWLHRYAPEEIRDELRRAHEAIAAATGREPRGFRGPGFSLSGEVLRALAELGYTYDASTFPTFLGPLARLYYFWNARGLDRRQRRERARLFGTWRDGLRPLRPYQWRLGDRSLVEIPVTTMPIVRAPIHMSYLLWLAARSPALAMTWLGLAAGLLRALRVPASFLLHPLDFLGGDRVRELSFFPGMSLSTSFKLEMFDRVFAFLAARFRLVSMEEHARVATSLARTIARPVPADLEA